MVLTDNQGRNAGSLVPDRGPLSRLISASARCLTPRRPLYSVSEHLVDGTRYQVVVHHFYHEPLATSDLIGPVGSDARSATLRLTITDENNRVMHGETPAPGAIAASRPLEMLFFPAAATETEIITAPKRIWTLTVSADAKVMRNELAALIAAGEGHLPKALALLSEASAVNEGQIYTHFGPPGPYKPPHELWGETLLVAKKPPEALKAFEDGLRIHRGRTGLLKGAERARAAISN